MKKSARAEISGLLGWNLGLALALVVLALTFVFLANYLVSEKYSLEVLRQRLSKANIELELEGAAVEGQFSIKSLLLSAKNLGLVEAKEIDFIQRSGEPARQMSGEPDGQALSQGSN